MTGVGVQRVCMNETYESETGSGEETGSWGVHAGGTSEDWAVGWGWWETVSSYQFDVDNNGWTLVLLNLPSGGNWGGSWGCNTGGRASVDGDSAPIEYEISHLTFCIFECVLGDG